MVIGQKYKVRFFFDYGAGGCLWADNDVTRKDFGNGPIDKAIATDGKITSETLELAEKLDILHSDYYNKNYPPDPSLWRQSDCDDFNKKVDILLRSLQEQLSNDFEIIDKQLRYSEDADLDEYLKNIKHFKRH